MDLFKTWLVETPIAHRGYHDKNIPENSLAAFSKAIEKGYAIELDVQLLADGTVVVFHDDSLSRMTGNDGYIKYLNKEDLKVLKLKGTKEYKKRASKDARFLLYPSVAAVKEQRLLFREVERGSKQNVKW